MKKLLLSIAVIGFAFASQAQVVVAGVSPANIAGGYDFAKQSHAGWPGATDNGTWALALDFNIPGTYVQGVIELVNDGTPGTNATYGNLLGEEGCAALAPGSLTGKIAVIRRNTCSFAQKALNAQDAGAIAVIIVNREDATNISMTGGDPATPPVLGLSVTIPVVMVKKSDGDALIAESLNGPVTMFIGNKIGAFQNDIGMAGNSWSAPLIGKSGGLPSQLAQNAGEYTMDLGARIYNYGVNPQSNVSLTADITGPSGSVYSQTVSGMSIAAGDSIDVAPGATNTLPQYSNTTFPAGTYTVTYTTSIASDDFSSDNVYTATWVVQDSIFAAVELDPATGFPASAGGSRPSPDITSSYIGCVQIKDANASRLAVTGVYFSASTNASDNMPLDGEEMQVHLYSWDDVFTDLNDVNFPGNAFTLSEVAFGSYIYATDAQNQMVFGAFSSPYVLTNGQRYLACVETVNPKVFLATSNTNLTWNVDNYLESVAPIGVDGTWYATGFGADTPIAVAAGVVSASELGISESVSVEGIAYPNPANNNVTITLKAEGNATLMITDVTGKVAMTQNIALSNGNAMVNIASLEAGMYVFNVVLEDGRTSQFNVVKK